MSLEDGPDALATCAVGFMLRSYPESEILGCLFQALSIDPEHARAHVVLARYLLSIGEMDAGWREYEWANRLGEVMARTPAWSGQRLPSGARILVFQTGGAGDVIQFGRYIPLVAERCDEVVFLTSAAVAPLFTDMHPRVRVVTDVAALPPIAMHCRLLGLPGLYWHSHGYFTDGMAGILAHRSRPHPSPNSPLRVGVCWRGNPKHEADAFRSMPLPDILPLLSASGAVFYSLQKDMSADEVAGFGHEVPSLCDWAVTAGVIQSMDLVISVDTSVCHMAATLGVSTWILLPHAAEWRWLRNRADTPWYPTARLWRKSFGSDWPTLITEVKAELTKMADEKTNSLITFRRL